MTTMRQIRLDTNAVTFADPANIASTFKAKVDRTVKTVGGQQVPNIRTEFVRGLSIPLTLNGVQVNDTGSIRLSVSGALPSKAVLLAELAAFKAAVDSAMGDGAQDGFVPTKAVYTLV